ncbi:predicted protein [Uncinocarpus reesii 1704]|uniref:G domain-containing protein n=1 Tax=Uncinocarpus reesii (strain UAMH 1704) TaxID=336963 RepID=C4JZN3_UNCRE|nr:uncharacterized protein UREG_07634 [Uncinocarpus reesii 1704]EEP82769.1 predicted protein [Uncinocarpus reesii 1704]
MFSWIPLWPNSSPEESSRPEDPEIPGHFPDDSQNSQHPPHHEASCAIYELAGSSPPDAPGSVLREPFDPDAGLRETAFFHSPTPVTSHPLEKEGESVERIKTPEVKPATPRSNVRKSSTHSLSKRTSRSHKTAKFTPGSSPPSNESVIALFGMTGTGKTSFINKLTGANMRVGHNLHSMTSEIEQVQVKIGDITVTLVDTPGFDDTTRSDTEILTLIASWLKASYDENTKLTGMIYLHRISDNRMSGSSYKNLELFRSLCGMRILSHVILATTMWDKVTEAEGSTREKDLLAEATFWGDMKKYGALVRRYDGTHAGALALVDALLEKHPVTLKIQREMAIEKKDLIDTAAGKSITARLEKMAADHKQELDMVKQDFERALKESKSEPFPMRNEVRCTLCLPVRIANTGDSYRQRMPNG